MPFWAFLKSIIGVNLPFVIAAVAVIAGIVFSPASDYRWIGHAVIGLTSFGMVVVTVFFGAALARRIRRPPNRDRFRLHRRYGITMGLIMTAALSYGLWMIISDKVRPLNSIHGAVGLLIVLMSALQIAAGLSLRRHPMKSIHRCAGYLIAGLIILQITLGLISSPLFASSGQYPRYTIRWLTVLDETWQADGVIGPREYFFTRVLDGGNYAISYRTDGRYITIGMKVKTTGWVSVGITAGEGMKNSDFIFGYVTQNGQAVIEDHFGTSRTQHLPDIELGGRNDIIDSGGKEDDGFTVIEFKRPLVTDDKFDISLADGMQTIIWAYGNNDAPGMHAAQGYFELRPR